MKAIWWRAHSVTPAREWSLRSITTITAVTCRGIICHPSEKNPTKWRNWVLSEVWGEVVCRRAGEIIQAEGGVGLPDSLWPSLIPSHLLRSCAFTVPQNVMFSVHSIEWNSFASNLFELRHCECWRLCRNYLLNRRGYPSRSTSSETVAHWTPAARYSNTAIPRWRFGTFVFLSTIITRALVLEDVLFYK